MKAVFLLALACAALAPAGCDLQGLLAGFPAPVVTVRGGDPVELDYREGPGGLVLLRGRVNGRADVEFILDTGAPVTVLIDGPRTAGLALDTTRAKPLGDPSNPATPVGVIGREFTIAFGGVSYSGLSAVLVPARTMPCRERFEAVGFGGVIGADLFRRFVVEVDTAARRVRLHDPPSWRVPAGAEVLALDFRGRHPFVETKVALADGREIAARMNVDTGLNRALTLAAGSHPDLAMPAQGEVRRSCLVNGVREDRVGPPVTLQLGGARIAVPSPVYTDAPNPVDDARTSTIGVGLFQGRRLFIDYPGKRLALA
ncbi:MAG: hypothetical protein IPJ28_00880 [Betaproteobacteria bacterium]|nr:hypothetical protein [Betaproteobacteria bacterium]